jgi:hypothetical protein
MNADARVMEFFRGRLSRVESDAMVDHIEKHFSERGFGLWLSRSGCSSFYRFRRIGSSWIGGAISACYGFGTLALSEIVSATNHRSRAVMERLGMRRDPADDFDYPRLPEGHPLRRHVLYRLGLGSYLGTC